jgi:hypothetical protein
MISKTSQGRRLNPRTRSRLTSADELLTVRQASTGLATQFNSLASSAVPSSFNAF